MKKQTKKSRANVPNDREQLLEIKRRVGIKPYERHLELKKKGKGYNALCPFHDDHNPSLDLFETADGDWCFICRSCGAKGDIFNFVQRTEELSFPEAKKKLAESAGLTLKAPEPEKLNYDPVKGTARLPEIEDFLAKRGISLKQAQARGVGVLDHPTLGKSVVLPYGKGDDAPAKVRAIEPKSKSDKFRHLENKKPTDKLIYGLEETDPFESSIFVTESELDALMLISHGYQAVSVTSASSVVNSDGKLKFSKSNLEELGYFRVFIVTDMDLLGERCAEAFQRALPPYSDFRIQWQFSKGADGLEGAKDIGEFYALDPPTFRERFDALIDEAERFRTVHGLRYEPLTLPVFLDRKFEPPKQYLGPVIREKDINEIFASRGMGKTFVSLGMGLSIATGVPFLKWPVEQTQHVLYVDAEMSSFDLQDRLQRLTSGMGSNVDLAKFHPMNLDSQSSGKVPDIATPEGQWMIEDMIGATDAKVLFLDNLSSLAGIPDNDDEAWLPVGVWLLSLRRKGITTVMVHHAGKNGTQRGISRREDQLNTVIKLSKSDEWSPTDGLHVTLTFEKTRSFHGKDAEPLDVRLMNGEGGGLVWSYKPVCQSKFDRFKELHDAGATKEEIMQGLEIKKSMYYDYLRKAERELTLVGSAA